MSRVSRRHLARLGFAATLARASGSHALGRLPHGGSLRIRVPWPVERLDPYASDEPLSAVFAPFVTETLLGQKGTSIFPTLAEAMPTLATGMARIRLRMGLKTADGHEFLAADAVRSLARAKAGNALGMLSTWDSVTVDSQDPRTLLIRTRDPEMVASILASRACAMTEQSLTPLRLRGVGAFTAEITGGRLVLTRNTLAPRGQPFLESVVVEAAVSLAEALAAFEAGESAVGWFGKGLYQPRRNIETLVSDSPLGWVILRSEPGLGRWGAPGVLQSLLDGVDLSNLGHLGLGGETARGVRQLWGGPKTPLLVDEACPHFVEVAQVVGRTLSQPGHELWVKPVAKPELKRARRAGDAVLSLDFVGRLHSGSQHILATLLAAQDPKLALRPPKLVFTSAREVALTQPFGVVGEFRLRGACDARYVRLAGFEIADVWFRGAG